MKLFFKKSIIFLLPFIGIYFTYSFLILPLLLKYYNGPNTKEQIELSFKYAVKNNYDMLFLGNSRMYRGINPDKFDVKSFNFSHDNDSYNQLFYKLEYLNRKGKDFKYVVIGVDYFQFSVFSNSRNYVYCDLLENNYCEDYDSNLTYLKLKYLLGFLNLTKTREINLNQKKPFLKKNGQYILHGTANENDNVERNTKRLDIQVGYFKRILDFCEKQEIKLFLLIMPQRKNEIKQYTNSELEDFYLFINRFVGDNVILLDYSVEKEFVDIKNYTDITHFNEVAANKFSSFLNKEIKLSLNLKIN